MFLFRSWTISQASTMRSSEISVLEMGPRMKKVMCSISRTYLTRQKSRKIVFFPKSLKSGRFFCFLKFSLCMITSRTTFRRTMGLLTTLYQGVFKRTSTFTLAICVGAVGVRSFINHWCFMFLNQYYYSLSVDSILSPTMFGNPTIRASSGKTSSTNMRLLKKNKIKIWVKN